MNSLEDRLVASYSWACSYANSFTAFFSNSFDREELRSVGISGYVAAATRYDESKGSSFRGFCATRIRGAIIDELRRSNGETRSARRNQRLIGQESLALEANLQRKPTRAELAEGLGISEEELVEMQKAARPTSYVSLDDPNAFGEECLPLKETLADQAAVAPSSGVDLAELRRTLVVSVSKLPPFEAKVILLHYLGNKPFSEIAESMHLTRSRISQLHHQALCSLKKILKKNEGEDVFGFSSGRN